MNEICLREVAESPIATQLGTNCIALNKILLAYVGNVASFIVSVFLTRCLVGGNVLSFYCSAENGLNKPEQRN